MSKRIVINVLKYGLGVAALTYVLWRYWNPPAGGGPGLADALSKPISFSAVALASLTLLIALLFTFVRWYVLVRAQDLPFKLVDAVRLGLVSFFFCTFLPGAIGGDVIKAAFLAKEQKRRTVSVATVFFDRVIGLWALVCTVALAGGIFWALGNEAIISQRHLQLLVLSSTLIVVISLSLWLLLGMLPAARADQLGHALARIPRVGRIGAELWRAIWLYRRKRRSIAISLALSLVGQVFFVLTFYFSAQVFTPTEQTGALPSLTEHFLLVPVGTAFLAFFPAPGGVGGGELAFGWLYGLVGKPEVLGVLGLLAQRLVMCLWAIIGYVVYLRMRPSLSQTSLEIEPDSPAAPTDADMAYANS
jgi:uncharacterized membrane protein YbhN (UPF0104 family)